MIFLFICLFIFGSVEAASPHPYIKEKIWDYVTPYLIPDDHPAKAKLDEIFSKTRVTTSIKTMEKAGFRNVVPQKFTHIIVTSHPELEGYIIKVYLDAHRYYKQRPEYMYYVWRAMGSRKIQKLLDEMGWNDTFKVPKKWIYPLPAEPSPPAELIRKNFILIEEDMDIFDTAENNRCWESDLVDKELIDKFYYIVTELGLSDCAKPPNAPFSKDGRIAFVDTQTFDSWPVSYEKLTSFLSDEMRAYWKQLTK
jgi:hypothetical protein